MNSKHINKQKKTSIRNWWAQYPQTYGDKHGEATYSMETDEKISVQMNTQEFYRKVDETFYSWNKPLHLENRFFGKIFDYERYAGKNVLEVGCGMGTMAMNWASSDASITATDLNPVAVQQTRQRFKLFKLNGQIVQNDGENLPFRDGAFDYVYSWGVLHHTSNTKKAIQELYRVLKPGGHFGVMLYNRHSLLYFYTIYLREGVLHLENQFLDSLQLASRYTDGYRDEGNPHTWPITKKEAEKDLFDCFQNVQTEIFGTDVVPIFGTFFPGFSRLIPMCIVKAYARRWGWSVWITGNKYGCWPDA